MTLALVPFWILLIRDAGFGPWHWPFEQDSWPETRIALYNVLPFTAFCANDGAASSKPRVATEIIAANRRHVVASLACSSNHCVMAVLHINSKSPVLLKA
ncbi:MAG: hypothetical protein JNL19_02225 [Burkholderiales bacterium]|nr:hypothetical protein [Burkholderiales bacterium]